MMRNKTRIQKGTKKFLSVVLTTSMLMLSMLNGTMSYTTYAADLFSDQSMGESDEFTDKVEEDKSSVNTEEIPEAENVFSDGEGLNAREESSAGNKNVIILEGQTVNVKNGMFNVKNNHNGSLTLADGELAVDRIFQIQGSSKTDYCIAYLYSDYKELKFSHWNNSEHSAPKYDEWEWKNYSSDKAISLTNSYKIWPYQRLLYTYISVGRYENNKFSLATVQKVRNPVKVNYDSQGGTGGPTTDWVWNKTGDNIWNSNEPTKEGSRFLGWYTSPNEGEKITSVADVVSVSDKNKINEITLYAHWENHEHSWNYVTDENHRNILKAYCSNPEIQCAYYGTSGESVTSPVTLTLRLSGLENGCINYSGSAYEDAEIVGKDNFVSLTGASVADLVYVGRDGTSYDENTTGPTNLGKYTVKVAVGDSSNPKQYELTANFEITKANIDSTSGVTMPGWTYGSYNSEVNKPSLANPEETNPGGGKVTYSYHIGKPCTDNNKTSKANGAAVDGGVPQNAGTYYVKAEISETANYNSGTATGSFTISPQLAELQWSDYEFTYDGAEFRVYAWVKNAPIDEKFNLTYTDNEKTDAGSYEAKIKDLGNPNYSLWDENRNPIAIISHKWRINRRTATVIPADSEKHIGQSDPQSFTYEVEGLVAGEELYGLKLQREPGEDAGDYVISATEDANVDRNYTVDVTKKGTFTIKDHEWTEKEVIPATTWSEGMKVKTCEFAECSYHQYGKYYTIPKINEENDKYADVIDKYTSISGSYIEKAMLNNKESQFLLDESKVFEADEKENIKKKLNKAEVRLSITAPYFVGNQMESVKNETNKIAGKEVPDCFFDASLYSQFANNAEKKIAEPGIPISIRFKVPDNMLNKQPYTIRDYKIIRLHKNENGKDEVAVLNADFNSSTNEVTFETDKLSIFALTYKDTYYSPSYPVTGLKVSPESIMLTKKDETAQLTAEVTPSYADNKKVTWKSGDEKVATVDENGKVTAVGNGTATITATSVSGSYTATVSVTVKIPVEIEKLTIEAEKNKLTQIGETTDLKVKIEPENADEQKLIWKSDNEMVASVDANGKVTAVGNGTATITVTTEDGKVTASITITVEVPQKSVINKTTGFGRLKARSVKQTKTSVTLQWNRIKGADGYLIYGNLCNVNGKEYKYKKLATITSGKTQTWTQKELKKGTFYKYVHHFTTFS